MSLVCIYHNIILNYPNKAILPYSQSLNSFVGHAQQLEMESNGKIALSNNTITKNNTSQIIFGETGTQGQHSF